MTIRIAENIRAYRKERKLTQEQLAEALGVTVGAVSKWESGASVPDISLIVAMAGFFETSVDVLLGYGWQSGGMGQAVALIRQLRNEKRFSESSAEVEKALLKYPNSFELVFQGALQYCLRGVEQHDKKSLARSLALFERSLELIGQNHDEHINEWTVRNNIADVYQLLGDTDKALELMKKNNAARLNDEAIGCTLANHAHRPDEALPYLSDALIDAVTKILRLSSGYMNAYCDKGEYGEALSIQLWMLGIVEGLKKPGTHSYLDRESVQLLAGCTVTAALSGDTEAARRYLKQAMEAAERFDAEPCYGYTEMRFFHGDAHTTAFDDFGDTAAAGVIRMLEENEADCPVCRTLLEELTQTQGGKES